MAKERLAIFMLVIGILLISISHLWTGMSSMASRWTEQDAQETTAATMRLHQLMHQQGHRHHHHQENEPSVDSPDLEDARRQFERQQEKLDKAQAQGKSVVLLVRWSGVALAVVGTIAFVFRQHYSR